jgi:ABC-2 type transport system ATP-binding protein
MKQSSNSSCLTVIRQSVPEMPVISVADVTMCFPIVKRYREMLSHPLQPRRMFTALSSVTVKIQEGDRVAVMGPNGAGKTTLLKLIGGLILPTKGDIVVNGFSTIHHSADARKSVGFVLNEERSFFWRLTGTQNLEFFGALDNLGGADLHNRIRELISLVGLDEGAAARAVEGYSSGMKQRLALARGLIANPSVLILDEPTRALDPIAADEMIDLILSRIYSDTRKTLLIATHRMDEALKLCNKILVIDKGRIQAFDSISDLKQEQITLPQYYRRALAVGAL